MRSLFLFLLFLMPSGLSYAGVNLKNGNFYISYQIVDECDMIDRTYNSKSSTRGWFGFGWGSPLETRLLVIGNGAAVVLENGSGASRFYGRQQGSAVSAVIEKLIENIRATTKLDRYEVAELRQKLADKEERTTKIKDYGISGQLAEGEKLVSDDCSQGNLQRRGEGYVRTSCNGELDYFNKQGWFVKHEDKNGRTMSATYAGTMYPQEIKDSNGCVAKLEWKSEGLISSVLAERGGKSERHTFTYNAAGDLILDNTIGGNYYKFSYDRNHNMTEIGYIDLSKMKMTYDEKSLATSVTEPDGSKKIYEYQTDSSGAYSTKVIQLEKNGEQQASSEYKYSKDGQLLRRSTSEGYWIEYEYHPTFEKITLIRTAAGDKTFVYNQDGDLVRKTDEEGDWIEYEYNPVTKKIISIRDATGEKKFGYDAKGQINHALDVASGKQVWLVYDTKGQIVTLTGKEDAKSAKRVLQFKYNALSKPIEIKIEGEGSLNVTYDDAGEIKEVKSNKGTKMALFVTQAFQSMLSLVKMSGANVAL